MVELVEDDAVEAEVLGVVEMVMEVVEVVEVLVAAAVSSTACVSGLKRSDPADDVQSETMYAPSGRLAGTVNVACPVGPVVAFFWYAIAPLEMSCRVTVASGAGLAVVDPSGVWSAVTVIVWPGLMIPGMVAC